MRISLHTLRECQLSDTDIGQIYMSAFVVKKIICRYHLLIYRVQAVHKCVSSLSHTLTYYNSLQV